MHINPVSMLLDVICVRELMQLNRGGYDDVDTKGCLAAYRWVMGLSEMTISAPNLPFNIRNTARKTFLKVFDFFTVRELLEVGKWYETH